MKLCRHCRMPYPSECICDDDPALEARPEPDTDGMPEPGRGWNEP